MFSNGPSFGTSKMSVKDIGVKNQPSGLSQQLLAAGPGIFQSLGNSNIS